MGDISKQEKTSICPPDASCIARPDLQSKREVVFTMVVSITTSEIVL
jgi:hypothetical protein